MKWKKERLCEKIINKIYEFQKNMPLSLKCYEKYLKKRKKKSDCNLIAA